MSASPFDELLSGSQSSNINAELLETLGKQAAARFLKEGSNLNETIGSLVSQHSGINNEHTKRISEFANNQVFQELHSKSDDKNVHFDVADPGVIIRDMKDGGSPAHTGKTLDNGKSQTKSSEGDYTVEPGTQQHTQNFDSAFEEFNRQDQNSGVGGTGEPISKTAGAFLDPNLGVDHSLHSNPVDTVYDTHLRLQASREKLASVHEEFDLLYKTAEEDYFLAAKHEVLSHGGAGMAGVIQATKLAAPSDSVAFKALRKVAERLVAEGVPSDELLKTASDQRLLNPNHPLAQSFSGLVKAAEEISRSRIALGEVDKGLEKTAAFLKTL
jgi:hypothetical protein